MKLSETLKSIRDEYRNWRREYLRRPRKGLDQRQRAAIHALETDGFHVIPEFYDAERCRELRAEIERLIDHNPGQLEVDPEASDHRLFGANLVSRSINEFYEDTFIMSTLREYERDPDLGGYTMAARMKFRPSNRGSGGGWHRDVGGRRQSKAIIYLNEVNEDNGPFQFMKGSHRPWQVFADQRRFGWEPHKRSFTELEMEHCFAERPGLLKTFTAAAGTLILADTRGIHRGKPMTDGARYALTNYLWPWGEIPAHMQTGFAAPSGTDHQQSTT